MIDHQYRARFYLNPNGIAIASGDILDVFTGYNSTAVFHVQLQKTETSYQLRAGLVNDAAVWTEMSWYDIPDGWTAVEVNYQALMNAGSLTLWLDGEQQQTLVYVDNDTQTLTAVRLGAQGIETNTRGTIYFDDFESRRFSYIGTLPDVGVADIEATAGWQKTLYDYDGVQPHAVTSLSESTTADYEYDANGNMTCRVENGTTYKQEYNAENRMISIQKLASGTCSAPGALTDQWDFVYDGDGVRTTQSYTAYEEGVPDPVIITSYYFGGAYEVTDEVVKKYYSIAGMMVAMDDGTELQYLLTDHLGSTVAVTDSDGDPVSQQRYLPFGQPREVPNYAAIEQTDLTYTGQRDVAGTGLMDYKARFYSPYLNRFIQPDSIIPNAASPQSWNRYSYVSNNPIGYSDPSGHSACDEVDGHGRCVNLRKSLKESIEKEYGVKVTGSWDADELSLLDSALDKISVVAGGVDNLKDIFRDGMDANSNGKKADQLTFKNTKTAFPCRNGGSACWTGDTIVLSDFIFSDEYQEDHGQAFLTQSADAKELGIQLSMIHEIAHIFADARPDALDSYTNTVTDRQVFYDRSVVGPNCDNKCLDEENMASAIALYAVTNVVYSGRYEKKYASQMDFVANTMFKWEYWQWKR